MNRPRTAFLAGFLLAIALAGGLLVSADSALAQALTQQELFGGQTGEGFAAQAGFTIEGDITVIIARLIRTVLSFLGIIAVVLVLYGGFLWMTAAGSTERVAKAKKVLSSALIGLLIVVSSFSIVQFVLSRLTAAVGGPAISGEGPPPGGFIPPGGSSTAFTLASLNTECAEALRNFELQMVFSKSVNATSVEDGGIVVEVAGGGAVPGQFTVSGKRVTFRPDADCADAGFPNERCFAANTGHVARLNSAILRSTGGTAPTGTTSFPFTTGTGIDTTGPTVAMSSPADGASVYAGGLAELLQAEGNDDTGVSLVEFFVAGSLVYEAGIVDSTAGSLTPANFFQTDDSEWNTAGYVTNRTYGIRATGYDCTGRSATSGTVEVVLRAPNCSNGVQDAAEPFLESGVDCGGNSSSQFYCGSCDGEQCTEDADCASGVCGPNGTCEAVLQIDRVSPGDGAVGNLITIAGRGFGATPPASGGITFLGSGVGTGAYDCSGALSWSDKQIVIAVPGGASSGALSVANADGLFDRTDQFPGPFIPDFQVNDIVRPGICALAPAIGEGGMVTTVLGTNFGPDQASVFGTLYFNNFAAADYTRWQSFADGTGEIDAVVPLLNGGTYNTQLFTGANACATSGNACNGDFDCAAGEACLIGRQGSNKVAFQVIGPDAGTMPAISFVDTGWQVCSGGTNADQACGSDADCAGGSCIAASNWGPPGQYATVIGSNFGTGIGQVVFRRKDNPVIFALGDTEFPPMCENTNFWRDGSVTVKVPALHQDGPPQTATVVATYDLFIRRADGIESAPVNFELRAGETPGPAICAIQPSAGPAGTEVSLLGENFGSAPATVLFTPGEPVTGGFIVQSQQVSNVVIPASAQTGLVRYENTAGLTSNQVPFTVGDCREDANLCGGGEQCCANGSCAVECALAEPESHYAYLFSTGPVPLFPTVLVQCAPGLTPSPSPWENHTSPDAVCLNAAVGTSFSMPMDAASFSGNILVERCLTTGCAPGEREAAAGTVTPDSGASASFTWSHAVDFLPSSRYVVTLQGGPEQGVLRAAGPAQGGSGENLQQDFTFEFTTSASATPCEVGSVNLEPGQAVAREKDEPLVDYLATPIAAGSGRECLILQCEAVTWQWSQNSVGQARAPLIGAEGDPGQTTCENRVRPLVQTEPGSPALITATALSANNPFDVASLVVDFTDPSVTSFFPNCQGACVNADLWAGFNTSMEQSSVVNGMQVLRCNDGPGGVGTEACNSSTGAGVPAYTVEYLEIPEEGLYRGIIRLNDPTAGPFAPRQYYKVRVAGDAASRSGVPLSVVHGIGGFEWVFRTKADGTVCRIDRVEVKPENNVLTYVGARQPYAALAFGAPDDCSLQGQTLNPKHYDWNPWTATDEPDHAGAASRVAAMLSGGAIMFSPSLPAGCTGNCLSAGTSLGAADPICGNGIIEIFESCDDDNTVDGDGCSSVCLREGAGASTPIGICGDGVIDRLPNGAGEDCDDGNTIDGDGCSSSCLSEGAAKAGFTCGNGDVATRLDGSGELCDDGNTLSGDGCSSQCLNEGSFSENRVVAICGNGIVERPAESCDDGQMSCDSGASCSSHAQCFGIGSGRCKPRSGDGCSALCKAEGTSACVPGVIETGCCGNGVVEFGEECDDGNAVSKDGCSSSCLLEGSSYLYAVPSFCGDSEHGTGEVLECEDVSTIDLAVGPYAIAEVDIGAVAELVAGQVANPDLKTVTSRVAATADGVSGNANLSLSCACTTDASCGESAALGCGNANCCYERPAIDSIIPASGENDVCRNAAVQVAFSQPVSRASLGAPEQGAEPSVYLRLVTVLDEGTLAQRPIDIATDCPSNYVQIAIGETDGNVFVRAWNWMKTAIKRIFSIASVDAQAVPSLCLVPVQYQLTDGGMLASLSYGEPLLANAGYQLVVGGDGDIFDAVKEGVIGTNGVGLASGGSSSFQVGGEICTLDAVITEDQGIDDGNDLTPPSSGFITTSTEIHQLVAAGYTMRGGQPQKIQPLAGYHWSWSWNSSMPNGAEGDAVVETLTTPSAFTVNPDDTPNDPSIATARAATPAINGEETVIATATIANDSFNIPSTIGRQVNGEAKLVVLLCENPWPSVADFPFIESGGTDPASATNFGFYYCRDAGPPGPAGDLPALRVVEVPNPAVTGILKEFLFILEGTGDAIGVRVLGNADYLPPDIWYAEQGFLGAAVAGELDGYQSVRDGNTVYAFAANQRGDIFPNIYVVSTTERPGQAAADVFGQSLEHFTFNANTDAVSDLNICKDGTTDNYLKDPTTGQFVSCVWDRDCVSEAMPNGVCDAEKAKLQRDTQRLQDLVRIQRIVAEYGERNGHCSLTRNQSCVPRFGAGQCPGTEFCVPRVPELAEGTFIRTMATSKWPSWTAQLGNALGTALPEDPLNEFSSCGGNGLDPETCFSAGAGTFQCAAGSHLYGFRSFSAERYDLTVQLEHDEAPWFFPIDKDPSDNATLVAEYAGYQGPGPLRAGFVGSPLLCAGTTIGDSTQCGDGIRGPAEVCEIGEVQTVACGACSTSGSGDCSTGDTGLVSWWQAEGNTIDAIGNGTGSPSGGLGYAQGVNGQAFDFNGTDSIMTSPGTAFAFNDLTYEFWLRPDTISSSYAGLISRYTGAFPVPLSVLMRQGRLVVLWTDNTNVVQRESVSVFTAGAWHHVVVAYTNGTVRAYVNGNEVITHSGTTDFPPSIKDFVVGRWLPGTYHFDGRIDELRVFDRALSPGEIPSSFECSPEPQTCVAGQGLKSVACINDAGTCRFETAEESAAECAAFQCGNGVVEPGEVCDDGSNNGEFGFCGADCTRAGSFRCGDGFLAGGEQCDCGTVQNFSSVIGNPSSWASINGCDAPNGQYVGPGQTGCAFDCKVPGPSCGDNIVNGGEQCDGNAPEQSSAGCAPLADGRPTVKTRTCSSTQCTWSAFSACLPVGSCGDGIVQGGEACDDGNTNNNDACTNQCNRNICGDGFVYQGVESCDDGAGNGTVCEAGYGGTCFYCTASCQFLARSGPFCGDGALNGNEVCDGTVIAGSCLRNQDNIRTVGGRCDNPNVSGNTCTTNAGAGNCTYVGVCNGGPTNGQPCSLNYDASAGTYSPRTSGANSASCGTGGTCVVPQCNSSCSLTCGPVQFQSAGIQVRSGIAGSAPRDSIDLYSFNSGPTPDTAEIFLPACQVGVRLIADIDKSQVDPPDVDIIFVTDLSGSMNYRPQGSSSGVPLEERRIYFVAKAMREAVNDFFKSYRNLNAELRIGLVTYRDSSIIRFQSGSTQLFTAADEQILLNEIGDPDANPATGYVNRAANGTPTGAGLQAALDLLSEHSDAGRKKYIVLLTDGPPDGGDLSVQSIKQNLINPNTTDTANDIGFFSATIATTSSLIGNGAHMSSDACGTAWSSRSDCQPLGAVEYAFDAKNEAEILEMYDAISDAILGISLSFITAGGQITPGQAREGSSAPLPFPDGFSCTGSPVIVPLRIEYEGTGPTRLSNFRFDYCPSF